MVRKYPVKTVLFIAAITCIDYSAQMNFVLSDSSVACLLKSGSGGSSVVVIDTSYMEEHGGSDRLIAKQYEWFAVPGKLQHGVAMDFSQMSFTGDLVEVRRSLPERLVGHGPGYYHVFDSPEGNVLIMSDMLDCQRD